MIRDPTFTKKQRSESVDPDPLRLFLDPDPMIRDPRKYFQDLDLRSGSDILTDLGSDLRIL